MYYIIPQIEEVFKGGFLNSYGAVLRKPLLLRKRFSRTVPVRVVSLRLAPLPANLPKLNSHASSIPRIEDSLHLAAAGAALRRPSSTCQAVQLDSALRASSR